MKVISEKLESRQEFSTSFVFIFFDSINSNDDLSHIAKSVYYYAISKIEKVMPLI